MEQTKLKAIFNKYYKGDDDFELAIQKLKDSGASQMECTRTLIFELKLSLTEADNIVVNSKAWSKNKDIVNKLRDNLYNFGKYGDAIPNDKSE